MSHDALFSKAIIQKYLPNISSFCGTKRYEFIGGKSKGVEAIDVFTGSGFEFTVLPDRGCDIVSAKFKGIPVAFVSKGGVFAPAYFQNGGMEFLKVFYGGLLTTCGLTQAGTPCTDIDPILGEVELGLHGRVNCIPADNVGIHEYWLNDEYIIDLTGVVRQSELYGENLVLERRIRTWMGASRLSIEDRVRNEGGQSTPLMVLYHVNFSYPFVSKDSRLHTTYGEVEPFNEFARKGSGRYDGYGEPTPGYLPDNFRFSKPRKDRSIAALVNSKIKLAGYVDFDPVELPFLTEWIQLSPQDYVVGLEPGNCLPEGRKEARKNGRLVHIEPAEEKIFHLEIGIATETDIMARLAVGSDGGTGQ